MLRKHFIRPKIVLIISIISLLSFTGIIFFLEDIILKQTQNRLESLLQQPVQIESVSIAYYPFQLHFNNIHVVNSQQLTHDSLFIDDVFIQIKLFPLLFKRLVVNSISINTIHLHVLRKKPYQLNPNQKHYLSEFNISQNNQSKTNLSQEEGLISSLNTNVDINQYVFLDELEMYYFVDEQQDNIQNIKASVSELLSGSFQKKRKRTEKALIPWLTLDKKTLKINKKKASFKKHRFPCTEPALRPNPSCAPRHSAHAHIDTCTCGLF